MSRLVINAYLASIKNQSFIAIIELVIATILKCILQNRLDTKIIISSKTQLLTSLGYIIPRIIKERCSAYTLFQRVHSINHLLH